jgi:hypothetical protein
MSISSFSSAHRVYVKSLYKRYLNNALDWTVRRDQWRSKAIQIRAEFERNRCVFNFAQYPYDSDERCDLISNVHDPRALAVLLEKAEEELAHMKHPDPYIRECRLQSSGGLSLPTSIIMSAPLFPGGTKW